MNNQDYNKQVIPILKEKQIYLVKFLLREVWAIFIKKMINQKEN